MKPSIAACPGIEIFAGPVDGDVVYLTRFCGNSTVIGINDVGFWAYKICNRQQFNSCAHTADIVLFVADGHSRKTCTAGCGQLHSSSARLKCNGKLQAIGCEGFNVISLPCHNTAKSGTSEHNGFAHIQASCAVTSNEVAARYGSGVYDRSIARPITCRFNLSGEFDFETVGKFNTVGCCVTGLTQDLVNENSINLSLIQQSDASKYLRICAVLIVQSIQGSSQQRNLFKISAAAFVP